MSALDKIQTLQNIKEDIKTSIQSKGVEVGDDFTTYANAIYSIEGGSSSGTPIYYLFKERTEGIMNWLTEHNKTVRNVLLEAEPSEEFPIIYLKDNWNDTICNNVYVKDGYVEIQCFNTRVDGQSTDTIEERFELTEEGWLRQLKSEPISGGGSGDGGGANVVELTQEEYDNLGYKDSNTFYVITDAPAVDTSDFATKTDLSNALGDIETILDNIIGDTNDGGGNGSSIFPL